MVYVTGDTHGDISRLTGRAVRRLKKGDVLLICGDFGFIWYGDKRDETALKKLSRLPFDIAFVDGIHENYDLLERYPVEEWNGGRAQTVTDRIHHLLRGECYTIEGHTFFAFGGGEEEEDAGIREASGTDFDCAMPSGEEMLHGWQTLKEHDNRVDYSLTHRPPGQMSGYLTRRGREMRLGGLHVYFNRIEEQVTFRRWFFGSLHIDKALTARHLALFSSIVPVED